MTFTVADQLVASLMSVGVTQIYGVVVDGLNPIVDASRRSGGQPKAASTGSTCATRKPPTSRPKTQPVVVVLTQGEPQYDDLDRRLAGSPPITVPTITIGSDFDGPNKDGTSYRKMFTGPYSHRVLDGIGHNVPPEAPQDFANAVIAVDGH
jgi:pimeloyl-ACP methyl ester carboxylesterase